MNSSCYPTLLTVGAESLKAQMCPEIQGGDEPRRYGRERGLCLHLPRNWVSLSLILSWFRDQAPYNFTDNISFVAPKYRKASLCLGHTEPTQQDAPGTDTAFLDAWARVPAQAGLGFPVANRGASSSGPVASWVTGNLQVGPGE